MDINQIVANSEFEGYFRDSNYLPQVESNPLSYIDSRPMEAGDLEALFKATSQVPYAEKVVFGAPLKGGLFEEYNLRNMRKERCSCKKRTTLPIEPETTKPSD